MSVRVRVAIALVLVAAPAPIAVAWLGTELRHQAFLETAYAATVEHMESGGRARCEQHPAHFSGPRGRHGPHRPHAPAHPPPPLHSRGPFFGGARLRAYDAQFETAVPRIAPLEAPLRDALQRGERVAAERIARDRVALAMRMPWDEGPCAAIVVEPPHAAVEHHDRALAQDVGVGLVTVAIALFVALAALGSPLRRLTALAEAVRARTIRGWFRRTGRRARQRRDRFGRAGPRCGRRPHPRARRSARGARPRIDRIRRRNDPRSRDTADRAAKPPEQRRSRGPRRRSGRSGADRWGSGRVCEYIAQLVANMATAARLEGGTEQLARAPVDLATIIERVVDRHRAVARHHRVTLDVATPESPVSALGDDILLERALSNLVHNAIRHRKEGSHVAIVLEREGSTGFCLRVIDDGGADEALVAQLARGEDVPDPRRARARGLGLRIVRRVIDAHGFVLRFARAERGLEVTILGVCNGAR